MTIQYEITGTYSVNASFSDAVVLPTTPLFSVSAVKPTAAPVAEPGAGKGLRTEHRVSPRQSGMLRLVECGHSSACI